MVSKNSKLKKVILLGSGALKIGEAGEFDYSGSQAAKALREEGIKTIIINPNIATIQTSSDFADKIYFLPVTPYFVQKVIEKEKPDGILLGFGGQTALNCGLTLAKKGVFKKYHVKILGTPVSAIEKTEDRLLFRKCIMDLGFKVPKSVVCRDTNKLKTVIGGLSFPVIVRAGFSLGGLGSGVARNIEELIKIGSKALALTPQILIEEYLEHWKEIEYEVVRDAYDNTITVCNMENFDPMGIHTGESIVVAPSQTLNNKEYHSLRKIAIEVVKSLPVVGECNIQFGLSPKNGDYRIIEVNARLSRSSALASKATGYPLAYIAAKLALGYSLSEIQNQVTGATSAFFEPALDYVVVKIPRWDFLKFKDAEELIGSEMQSVGEVMSIGRTFEEAFQKAIRSLDIKYEGIISDSVMALLEGGREAECNIFPDLSPTPSRPYKIAHNIFFGQNIDDIYKQTGIDKWFLERIKNIADHLKSMLEKKVETPYLILKAKKLGYSDKQLGMIFKKTEHDMRLFRKKNGIIPKVCQIDTLAGEFPAKTNYLYMSYHRQQDDISQSTGKKVAVLGGGSYQIGSSVEFDWCAVNSVITARKLGYQTIMINCNPETVSTDYDISDKLYFEELTLERVLDISDFEKCPFIVSVGGQIPNTLAPKLVDSGVKILGTSAKSIDMAEDRQKFSALLDKLKILQPQWRRLSNRNEALNFAQKIGYPVLVRPSYVLSGRAMFVAYSSQQFSDYLSQTGVLLNPEYPMVISKFIRGAKEVDFDAVAQKGKVKVFAISEHIEHAGVHSGDASLVLPNFSLSTESVREIKKISQKICKALNIDGPFNIQYIINETGCRMPEILVIEANLRSSRSFPFVSKVMGLNFITVATSIMLLKNVPKVREKHSRGYGVKVPHFSFTRLRHVDPVLRVEMASTGEVASFGKDIYEAYLKSLLSTGLEFPKKSALVSLGGEEGKERLLSTVKTLHFMGFKLYATQNTSSFLKENGIPAKFVYKVHEKGFPNVVDIINSRKVGMVINLSDRSDLAIKHQIKEETDGFLIRRAAVDVNIPLFTKATIANIFVEALFRYNLDKLQIKSWDEYVK
ncbi:carbamoyl-phosphate synthase (glutamine-hydrolyzing) large subunit [Patescibacteria group bacterium]|nr:carbamoyl-phosphate synthase (glutamine-hydrolyzing) large subunit [Patescibacteria group bacterium]MCL5797627.1 carbamoyl-phosphate synthase (glutamine-hydrolyzing) large subunit [Patescibacteria group bacterium]